MSIIIPEKRKDENSEIVLDFNTEYAVNNGTSTKTRGYGNSPSGGLTISHTGGSQAEINMDINKKFKGKYFRLYFHIHDLTAFSEGTVVNIRFWTSENDFYAAGVNKSNVIEGPNQYDLHFNAMSKSGTPNIDDGVEKVQILVISDTGDNLVTFDTLEICYRKPWIVMVQDGVSKSITEDILPLFANKNLPMTILPSQEGLDDVLSQNDVDGIPSIVELQNAFSKSIISGGIHNDCSQIDYDEFKNQAENHIISAQKYGLINNAVHCCALQNDYNSVDRYNFLKGFSATMRFGANTPDDVNSEYLAGNNNEYNYIMPASNTCLGGIRGISLNHLTTENEIREIMGEIVENQVGAYITGHGTCKYREEWCTETENYIALLDEYEEYRDKIDWISMEELYERYKNSRKDVMTMRSAVKRTHTPLGG